MLLAACGGEDAPRTGDLLFQLTAAEGMTDAIVAATERGGAVTFSHVGIVEAMAGGAFVVEAVDTSVRRTPLGEFLARSARRGGRPIAAVGRVSGADSTVVQRALRRAHERLGLPYDDEFLPANGKLYCSELAWECFVAADDSTHLLRSRPMTFRTADGELPAYWAEHFAALGMPVFCGFSAHAGFTQGVDHLDARSGRRDRMALLRRIVAQPRNPETAC